MHIPDGLIAPWIWIPFLLLTIILLYLGVRKIREKYDEKIVPYMGIMAAFIFAAQFVNFPVPGGTSGHLVGGTLLSIIFGPWAAVFIIFLVLIIQAFMGDGGITVIGVNTFNMGIIGAFLGLLIIKIMLKILQKNNKMDDSKKLIISSAIGSYIAIVIGAMMVPIELALSGISSWVLAVPSMLLYHLIIGIGEALITAAVLYIIIRSKPDMIVQAQMLKLNLNRQIKT
ncbi:MAG: energy-coupling factor ABC transporter permease [Promethearchaeota archaeon]